MPLSILGRWHLQSISIRHMHGHCQGSKYFGFLHATVCVTVACSLENDSRTAVSIERYFAATRPLRDSVGLP